MKRMLFADRQNLFVVSIVYKIYLVLFSHHNRPDMKEDERFKL